MVDKFKTILQQIISEKGSITVFAIMKMDDLTDKWTVILSAPWATKESRQSDFDYVRSLLIKSLTPEEMASVARIGIFSKENELIQDALKYKANMSINEDTKMNGNIIHYAHILASNSDI